MPILLASHHNKIPRIDGYGRMKPALTGVMLCLYFSGKSCSGRKHVAVRNNPLRAQWASVCYSCLYLPVFIDVCLCISVCLGSCLFFFFVPQECVCIYVYVCICALRSVCVYVWLSLSGAVWQCVAPYVSGFWCSGRSSWLRRHCKPLKFAFKNTSTSWKTDCPNYWIMWS